MKFLRNLLAAILGCLIAFGIACFMLFIFISLVGNTEEIITVNKNSVLELQLQQPIKDYTGNDGLDPFAGIFERSQGLDEILHAIKVAKEDDNIKGISIHNTILAAGLSQTKAIRKALEDFKSSDKFIYAYADFYNQKEYYLASVADSVYLNPVGDMDFKGLSSEVLFFKDLQEKSGIKMEVIRHGKYKSAVEPFLSNEMSQANRTQIKELIGSLWNSMIADISKERGIPVEGLNVIADTLGGRTPEMAKASGLIDQTLFNDEYEQKIRKASGVAGDKEVNYIKLADYVRYASNKKINKGDGKIAVIYAQGEILYGEGSKDIIGQDLINGALEEARKDKEVKAIVFRVNSPGGSALASDIIWREVELTKKEKPVIVSMGDVAASGGYYIAAGANKIFAEPTTITGSIGVFGTIPNISKLAENIGINAEQVGTNKNSVGYSLFEPMSSNYRNLVLEGVEDTYHTFLSRVAQGRNMTVAQVDSIGQGRVWSGVDAKKNGLVDQLGGLDDAIAEAANMAGLKSYGIKKYPKYKSGLERLMKNFGGANTQSREAFIEQEIGMEAYTVLKQLKLVMQQKGVQARLPFVLNIK